MTAPDAAELLAAAEAAAMRADVRRPSSCSFPSTPRRWRPTTPSGDDGCCGASPTPAITTPRAGRRRRRDDGRDPRRLLRALAPGVARPRRPRARAVEPVELPDGDRDVPVRYLDDVVSGGWIEVTTCGRRAANGWSAGDEVLANGAPATSRSTTSASASSC